MASGNTKKFYTFGDANRLGYLKWKGTTSKVYANPKSTNKSSVSTAFNKETMGFCLHRKSNMPSPGGTTATYSRVMTKSGVRIPTTISPSRDRICFLRPLKMPIHRSIMTIWTSCIKSTVRRDLHG